MATPDVGAQDEASVGAGGTMPYVLRRVAGSSDVYTPATLADMPPGSTAWCTPLAVERAHPDDAGVTGHWLWLAWPCTQARTAACTVRVHRQHSGGYVVCHTYYRRAELSLAQAVPAPSRAYVVPVGYTVERLPDPPVLRLPNGHTLYTFPSEALQPAT